MCEVCQVMKDLSLSAGPPFPHQVRAAARVVPCVWSDAHSNQEGQGQVAMVPHMLSLLIIIPLAMASLGKLSQTTESKGCEVVLLRALFF